MKTTLVILALLVASPAYGKSLYCVAWPHSERCKPPGVVEPVPTPPIVVAPLPTPAPVIVEPPVVARPIVVKPVKSVAQPTVTKRIKSNWVKPKRKQVVMPSWWSCAKARRHVAGKSQSAVAALEAWAQALGYTLNAEQKVIAKRCLGFS